MKFEQFSFHVISVVLLFSSREFFCTAQTASSYRLCVPEKSLSICNDMLNELNRTDGKISCVSANDKIGCITKVVKNEADFLPLEPEEIYVAHRFEPSAFSVITEIRSAEFANRNFRYEPVAIIKNSAGIKSISDLKGKKSCHTGFGRNAGWKIPFSHLMDKNELPPFCDAVELPTLEKDLYAVSNYFSEACAPGPYVGKEEKEEDRKLKNLYPNLCALCKSPNECSSDDKYSGYEGALKCLTEGSGDVAWTKMDAVEKVFKLKEGSIAPIASDYSFLCWDGSSVPLTSPRPCSWAKRPWRAILASKRLNATSIKDLQDQITIYKTDGAKAVEVTSIIPPWMTQVLEINVTDIEKHNPPSIAKTITSLEYLDSKNYTVTIEKPSCATKTFIKFCVLSEVEKLKCMDLRLASMGRRILPGIKCILGASTTDCMQKIKNEEADVMSLSPKEAERANSDYGLTPLLAELESLDNEGDKGAYRFAVAVVRKESQFHNISSLRGKRSCHGSIRSLAGWNIPLTVLRDAGEIEGKTCGLTIELAKYFNATCVPGARDPSLKMDWLPESLCSLCVGDSDGQKKESSGGVCQDNEAERYYGDFGALRCLKDKVADVAFIDHVSLRMENSEIQRDDLQLLCKNGVKMELTEVRHCNWGLIPSNKIVARNEDKDLIDRKDARFILLKMADNFKPGAKTESILKLFGPYYDNSDLLFKDTSVGLVDDSASKLVSPQIMKDFDYCTTSGAGLWDIRGLNVIFVTLVLFLFNRFCSY